MRRDVSTNQIQRSFYKCTNILRIKYHVWKEMWIPSDIGQQIRTQDCTNIRQTKTQWQLRLRKYLIKQSHDPCMLTRLDNAIKYRSDCYSITSDWSSSTSNYCFISIKNSIGNIGDTILSNPVPLFSTKNIFPLSPCFLSRIFLPLHGKIHQVTFWCFGDMRDNVFLVMPPKVWNHV